MIKNYVLSIRYPIHDMLMLEQVKTVVADKREEHVVDINLEDGPVAEINSAFNIAIMCLESEPSKRPSMAEVVKLLEQLKTKKPF